MSGVLGPQKAREPHNVTEAAMPGASSWCHRRPFQRCGGADISLAPFPHPHKTLIVANDFLETEVGELMKAASHA